MLNSGFCCLQWGADVVKLLYLLFYQLSTFKRNSVKELKICFKWHRRGTGYSVLSVQKVCGFISFKIMKY